ncbi:hypothetical protein NXH67_01850 [Butyrivibrio sp. DSM 10294]|uniref:hypothetical protein n=1 Tax=Butyrivibrio sp. DSM 10294 TaxID=2972457 RepID=UPI00234E6406|nr:hypothetical protein [Butyrivibrio sp. DSM 10294]MDC7292259.1 hypothetical protein [Butyrivibrio sp. DSM 10294]
MKKFCNSKNVKKSAVTAHFKRGLALAVAASVALTGADFTSMAVSDQAEIDPIEIAGFEDLAEEVAYQQLEVGASEADIVLPNTLRATKSIKEDNIIDEVDEEVSETPEDSQDDSSEDNGSESSDNNAELNEVPVEVIEEETPAEDSQEEEITVEEENIVARIIGGLFKNVFDSFSTTAYAADSEDITITGVEWSLSEELSDRAEFKADEQWLRYVYVPEIPSCYVTDATLPNITVDIIGGEVLGEVRVSDEPEYEELELLENDEFEDGDAEFEAEEAEAEEEPGVDEVAPEGEYSYISKANETKLIIDILKAAMTSGGSTPIIADEDLTKVEVSEVTPAEGTSEFFEVKKYTKSGETLVEDATNGEYGIHVLKAFNEEKIVTVKLKEKVTTTGDTTTPTTPKEYTFKIKLTADPATEEVEITVADKYVYHNTLQTLAKADVTVTKKSTSTVVPADEYDVEEISQKDVGEYSFRVTFKGASADLVQATGKWTIKPVEVKLVADNKASVITEDLQTPSYKIECINTDDAKYFTNVHTDQLKGVTVKYVTEPDKTKAGTYDITCSIEGTDPNYNIVSAQNVHTAKYYIVGKIRQRVKAGSATYDTSFTISKGTSYYATVVASASSNMIAKGASFYSIYKDSTGAVVAQVSANSTEGVPTEIGKYSVISYYKIGSINTGSGSNITVYSPDSIATNEITYEIVDSKTKITDSSVKLNKTSFTYNGKDQGPTVTVTVNNVKLVENTDYTVTGDEELDADDYEVTVTGKGNYEGTVTKSWKINKASIANATIPSGTKTSYSYTGSAITHETPETIKLSGFSDALESDVDFEVDTSKSTVSATKAGTYTVYLKGIDNFTGTKSYTWKITSSSSSSSTTGKATSSVNFSNPDNVTSGVSNVSSSALSSYATSKKEAGKTTTYTLNVKPISKSTLNSVELNAIAEYGDDSVVTTDSLNITVHRTVKDSEGNVEVDEDVSDLGASIDVACYIGTSNASKTINIIREHNGQIKKFDKLSARASSAPKDGTYYVDKTNGRVYIYSQYFSHFTLIYTATDAVVKTSRTGTASSSSSSSDPDALGARAPQTGDNLPVVWVWVIVLLAGVALIGFSAFELKRFKRGDFKKKR